MILCNISKKDSLIFYISNIDTNIIVGDFLVMSFSIKEFRKDLNLTQKEFSETFNIPISTLRKWEQFQASPPEYLCSLLIKTHHASRKFCHEIKTKTGEIYYYDPFEKTISDNKGNIIKVREDLSKVKTPNLSVYIKDLFDAFYLLQNSFNEDCEWDQKEDIIWS